MMRANPNPNPNPNPNQVCALAFGILSLLYLTIMLAGHRTFGDVTAANILINYAGRAHDH